MSREMHKAQRGDLVEWGIAAQSKHGEATSGDRHVVCPFPGGILLAAVDGLGHGDGAAAASEAATRILAAKPDASALDLVRRCHEGLLYTRGVVMSLASFSARDRTLTWIGVGNVDGILVRADAAAVPPRESLLLRGGVVGYQLPQLHASVIPVAPGDTLVFATDGVRSDFTAAVRRGEPPEQLANRILTRFAKGTDDALVLAVEFLGAAS